MSGMGISLPTLIISLTWHALLGMDMVIIGGAVAFLVCNMAIKRLYGSPKVITLAKGGGLAYGTLLRQPLLHMAQ